MIIRPETSQDCKRIRTLETSAFLGNPYSDGREGAIIDALRCAGALTVSLVAEENIDVFGHVAFLPVLIDGVPGDWYGLGPVAVRPDRQRRGIGVHLIEAGLDHLGWLDAAGCVVLGDPVYYRRFGFVADPSLVFRGVSADHFLCLDFHEEMRAGVVTYHDAVYVT